MNDEEIFNNQVNTLTVQNVSDYLADRDVQCPVCKGKEFLVYRDTKSGIEDRAQIRTSVLVARLAAGHEFEVGEGMSAPVISPVCFSCGFVLNFDATILTLNHLQKVDTNG